MAETVDHPDGEQDPKYGSFETADGQTALYDRDEPNAWLQSDATVPVRD
jgi:hypothetical protein